MRNLSTAPSSHATEVGRLLYGNQRGVAPAITQISVYESIDWLIRGFFKLSINESLVESSQIQNQSWINSTSIELLNNDAINFEMIKMHQFDSLTEEL